MKKIKITPNPITQKQLSITFSNIITDMNNIFINNMKER